MKKCLIVLFLFISTFGLTSFGLVSRAIPAKVEQKKELKIQSKSKVQIQQVELEVENPEIEKENLFIEIERVVLNWFANFLITFFVH